MGEADEDPGPRSTVRPGSRCGAEVPEVVVVAARYGTARCLLLEPHWVFFCF